MDGLGVLASRTATRQICRSACAGLRQVGQCVLRDLAHWEISLSRIYYCPRDESKLVEMHDGRGHRYLFCRWCGNYRLTSDGRLLRMHDGRLLLVRLRGLFHRKCGEARPAAFESKAWVVCRLPRGHQGLHVFTEERKGGG